MPWILLLLAKHCLLPRLSAATLPGVTDRLTTASQQSTPPAEPDVEQKRAAYAALADVLANDCRPSGAHSPAA